MANEIKLQTFTGRNQATGELVEWDLDEVLVNGQRVALVPHVEGAMIRLLRPMQESTIKEVHSAVVAQRHAQGKASISERVAELPDPAEMRKAAKSIKRGA